MMDQNFGMKEHHCLCWPRNRVAVLTQHGKHSPPGLKVGGSSYSGFGAGVVDSRWSVRKLVNGNRET